MSNRSGGRPQADGQPDLFAALADSTRRHLLEQLATRERTVSELVEGLPQSQAAISQHLKVLREAGLVESRQEGRFRRYRLRPQGLTELRDWLDALGEGLGPRRGARRDAGDAGDGGAGQRRPRSRRSSAASAA